MCANMDIYNKVRSVPKEAVKAIQAGRLKGKSDINPMWRIKMLTEIFGIAGFGWKIDIIDQWLTDGADGEVIANVKINLYVKHPETGEWSAGIVGIGGAMFVTNESKGKYNDDDAFKKAYTDAISIACKALGFCADIYYEKDPTKYDELPFPEAEVNRPAPVQTPPPNPMSFQTKIRTREDAIAYRLDDGRALTELYKTDKATFMTLLNNPADADMAAATKLIYQWVIEASKAGKQ